MLVKRVRAGMTSGYFIDLEEKGEEMNSSDCWCIIVFPYSLCTCQMLLLVLVSLVYGSSSTPVSLYDWVIGL